MSHIIMQIWQTCAPEELRHTDTTRTPPGQHALDLAGYSCTRYCRSQIYLPRNIQIMKKSRSSNGHLSDLSDEPRIQSDTSLFGGTKSKSPGRTHLVISCNYSALFDVHGNNLHEHDQDAIDSVKFFVSGTRQTERPQIVRLCFRKRTSQPMSY